MTEVLDELSEGLQDGREFNEDSDVHFLRASARLVEYLWKSGRAQLLRQCPLLTSEGKVERLTGSQQILAPVLRWPASVQPYADLYTERRVLSDRYCDDDTIGGALSPLIDAGLVIQAPLYKAVRPEIDDSNLLNAMSHGVLSTASVTVRNKVFGQIAFLSTDLVPRRAQNSELARLLLDFVLTVAAREDGSWRETKEVEGHRSGEQISLSLHGVTWPFELKVRSWVPIQMPDEEGFQPMPANESNLRDILDPTWLRNNSDAVDLLHQVFGFRQLTLLIDSLDAEIENDLVALLRDPDLVKSAVENPDAVKFASELTSSSVQLDSIRAFVQDSEDDEGLIEHLANRREQRRIVDKNQRLGYCVEGLVRENLEKAGFSVCRTGVGSDFEIAAELGDLTNLELIRGDQSWLVEVKATRDQRVRMTGTQAKKSREGRR